MTEQTVNSSLTKCGTNVRQFYLFDKVSGYSSCQVRGCIDKIKGNHAGNLERHLKCFHPNEYATVLQQKNTSSAAKRQQSKSITLAMSIEEIQNHCVELVTVNGRPFSLMDDSGFRGLINPLMKALRGDDNSGVSSGSVVDLVAIKAQETRVSIKNELKDRLISLKVDAVTRHDRGFLGVNAQFIEDGKIHVRTLGVKELVERHTAEYLSTIIQNVLAEYEIDISNIYSFTSDNGANMVKLGRLLEDIQKEAKENANESDAEDDDDDDGDDDGSDNQDDEKLEQAKEATRIPPLDESESCVLSNGITLISNIRCAAHTLQLAIEEALKKIAETKRTLAKARKAVKALRTPNVRQMIKLSMPNAKKPQLDVAPRWNSTSDMLESLLEYKAFCQACASLKDLHLSEKEWKFVEDYQLSLKPAKQATLQLQAEQLTPGSFYGIWLRCKMLTAEIPTQLATQLVKAMDRREEQLMQNDAILASVYLDPRFLPFLPRKYHATAIAKLEDVSMKLQLLTEKTSASEIASSRDGTVSHSVVEENAEKTLPDPRTDILQRSWDKLMASKKNKQTATRNLRRHLEDFEQTEILEPSQDILQYWESKKHVMPQLYQLAMVAHAAPATQVSVERLFSGVSYIFSKLRGNMKSRTLDNVMVVRCNSKNTKRKLDDGKKPRAKRQKLAPLPPITPNDAGTTNEDPIIDDSPTLNDRSEVVMKENVIPFNRI